MEETKKFVDFDLYCPLCKYEKTNDGEEPCNSCLTVGARENSHKPERWEAKH